MIDNLNFISWIKNRFAIFIFWYINLWSVQWIAAHIVFIFCEIQGVAVGMGLNGMKEIYTTADRLFNKGYREVNPFFMPKILINMAAGHVSLKYGFQVCKFKQSCIYFQSEFFFQFACKCKQILILLVPGIKWVIWW